MQWLRVFNGAGEVQTLATQKLCDSSSQVGGFTSFKHLKKKKLPYFFFWLMKIYVCSHYLYKCLIRSWFLLGCRA